MKASKQTHKMKTIGLLVAISVLFIGCTASGSSSSLSASTNAIGSITSALPSDAASILSDMQRDFNPNWHVNTQTPTAEEIAGAATISGSSEVTAKPVNLANISNPIASLNITSPEQIDRSTAEKILKGLGIMNGKRTFDEALSIIKWSNTYKSSGASFNAQMKEYLFKHYKSYKQALEKWGAYSEISEQATPELYESWIKEAANQLTSIEAAKRIPLMKSLMTQESGRVHWKSHVPVVSYAGAIGTGQFMYATAEGTDINPYDPQENIAGIAKYLNGLIKANGLRKGLACYNGGNKPPTDSYTKYADPIISRMNKIA